jgi:hypothetical protein
MPIQPLSEPLVTARRGLVAVRRHGYVEGHIELLSRIPAEIIDWASLQRLGYYGRDGTKREPIGTDDSCVLRSNKTRVDTDRVTGSSEVIRAQAPVFVVTPEESMTC